MSIPKPDVERRWLFGIAGLAWSIAGLMLLVRTFLWLEGFTVPLEAMVILSGALGAVLMTRYMFLSIVKRNLQRIDSGPERACAFGFQEWKSYAIMGLMIAMGITLRHIATPGSPLTIALAVVYGIMGGTLLAGSLLYHKRFIEAGLARAKT